MKATGSSWTHKVMCSRPWPTAGERGTESGVHDLEVTHTLALEGPGQRHQGLATPPVMPVQPQNMVQPQSMVQPQNTVQPQNMVQPQSMVQARGGLLSLRGRESEELRRSPATRPGGEKPPEPPLMTLALDRLAVPHRRVPW
ncbi:MAG: hypothetical protein ACKO6N_22450 [Myxococcota bacterium]